MNTTENRVFQLIPFFKFLLRNKFDIFLNSLCFKLIRSRMKYKLITFLQQF